MTTMAATVGDLRLLPSAFVFLVCFLLGAWAPRIAPVWLAVANLAVMMNALVIWGPALVRRLAEGR